MSQELTAAIARVQARHVLTTEEMTQAMEQIMSGQAPPEAMGRFLIALADRGEAVEELVAAARVMRAHALPVPLEKPLALCDTCGTGGDRRGTFNISTATALVVAAAGAKVAKHGNRAATSRCGSADVLGALGVNPEQTPEQVARGLMTLGFGFLFAPIFHPAMRHVAPVRKTLGRRTIFNLLGPLTNPAGVSSQLVGVSEAKWLKPMAEALRALGTRHALLVHSADGLDEVSIAQETQVVEVRPQSLRSLVIRPEEFGIAPGPLKALHGGDAAANAQIILRVLEGEPGPQHDVVVLNAACALYAADIVRTIAEGLPRAEAAIADEKALHLLQELQQHSVRPVEPV